MGKFQESLAQIYWWFYSGTFSGSGQDRRWMLEQGTLYLLILNCNKKNVRIKWRIIIIL